MAVTTNLILPLLETGQAQKETTVNTSLQYLDDLVGGYVSISVAGSANVTLTEAQARNHIIELTGVLTGNIQVKLPQRENNHIIYNNTSGSFSVTIVPVTSGTGPTVTQGGGSIVYYNGTNIAGFPISASAGAPASAQFLTLATDGTLTNERVFTAGANVLLTDAGAGSTLTVDVGTQNIAFAGDISPSQITADQNNYNPTGLSTASTLRLDTDASRTITGLAGGADGRIIIVHNIGANALVLSDENASSTAGNRFAFTGDLTLSTDDSCALRYDSTSSRWRLISTTAIAGAGAAPTNAQYLTLATNATLTVERVLTAGANLLFTDAGAGSTLTVDAMTQNIAFAGDISPSQITANQNDYNPTGLSTASTLRLDTDASRTLTGLAGGADGRIIIIHNIGSNALVLADENASSTAGNRFALTANLTMNTDDSCILRYDSTTSRWRLIASTASGASISGLTADKIVYATGGSAIATDTDLHYNAANNNLGIGATSFGASATNTLALLVSTPPSGGATDTVQLTAIDQAAANAGLGITTEGNIQHLLARSWTLGTRTPSGSMTQGLLINQAGSSDAYFQGQNTGVTHGMTSIVAASIIHDLRRIAADGGVQDRSFTSTTISRIISALHTTETTTKSTNADAALVIEVGTASGGSVTGLGANANMVAIQDRFAGNPTKWIADSSGRTWQTGPAVYILEVEANTAGSGSPNVLVGSTETRKVLTNEGATARNYHTLPTAVAGYEFTFVSQDSDLMRITAAAGDTIRVAGGVTATGGFIENGAQGDCITLISINATEWIDVASRGTWTPT